MLPKSKSGRKIAVILTVFILLILAIFLSAKKRPPLPSQTPGQPPGNKNSQITSANEQEIRKVPNVSFAKFEIKKDDLQIPQAVKIYKTYPEFQQEEADRLARFFGLIAQKNEGSQLVYYDFESEENRGYLNIDRKSGLLQYFSFGHKKLPQTSGQLLVESVRQYLLDARLIDVLTTCPVTYNDREAPGIIIVECHRSWEKTGLPILNFAGLINIPPQFRLKELELGKTYDFTPVDEAVINVTNDQSGRERPDDFNTVKAAIDDKGQIVSLVSNLKQIETARIVTLNDLLNPDEAIEKFKNGQADLSLIVPANINDGSWEEIFPGNLAQNLNGQVSDFMLVYLENPSKYTDFIPTYLVKGIATTREGKPLTFIMAINAFKETQSRTLNLNIAGLSDQKTATDEDSLKLGTFNPDQRMSLRSASPCVPAEENLSPILNLATYGLVGQFTIATKGQQRAGNWFLLPAQTDPLPDIEEVIAAFDELELEGQDARIRQIQRLREEWEKFNFCPLRLSGGSPTIFVYGPSGSKIRLYADRQLTYAYPAVNSQSAWEFELDGEMIKVNGRKYDSIYYEYNPLKFPASASGWTIQKSELADFAHNLGQYLGFNTQESDKLFFELNLAAGRIKTDQINISPIANDVLEERLPLIVSTDAIIFRYHFTVSSAKTGLTAPLIKPLIRVPEMVLEIGATAN